MACCQHVHVLIAVVASSAAMAWCIWGSALARAAAAAISGLVPLLTRAVSRQRSTTRMTWAVSVLMMSS